MPGKREKIEVTLIEMRTDIGSGWPVTYNLFTLRKPEEVRVQKKVPSHMTVEVSSFGKVSKSSLVYKKAKATTEKGGRVDWKTAGWAPGIHFGEPAVVYLPENLVGLVNDD